MNKTCKVYKSCSHVPCNSYMNKCRPEYCVPGSSSNWSLCNMSNWGKNIKYINNFVIMSLNVNFKKLKSKQIK